MPGGVLDGQAKATGTLVEIKDAGLEKRRGVPVVKVFEIDKILAKEAEIADEADEFFDAGDGGGLVFEGFVAGNERIDGVAGRPSQQLPDAGHAQLLDGRSHLGGLPRVERPQPGLKRLPIGLGQLGSVSEQWFDGVSTQGGEGGGVGGIDVALQGQGSAGGDERQRKASRVGGVNAKVVPGEDGVILLLAVEECGGAGVESGQTAAGKKVIGLGADGLDGGGGRRGGLAERPNGGVRVSRLYPAVKGRAFSQKQIGAGLVHARFSRNIIGASDAGDDFDDGGFGGVIGGGFWNDDAVAVEGGAGEGLASLDRLGQGDDGFAAGGVCDVAGGFEEIGAVAGGVADGSERERVTAFDEIIRILEQKTGPFDGGNQLRRSEEH